ADVLRPAGVRKADMLIAVAAIDEAHTISCMLADRLGVETTVARVRSDAITRTKSVLKATDFGIDLVIHPEESAAAEVARLVRRARASDIMTFAGGKLKLVGMRLERSSSAIGRSLKDLA